MAENQEKRNRKGGAENLRDKKIKALEADAAKCKKITSLFESSATVSIRTRKNDIAIIDTKVIAINAESDVDRAGATGGEGGGG